MNRIRQEVPLNGTPQEVYETLTSAEGFSALSGGAPATVSGDAGREFSLFDGMIVGQNVECVPGERLVQARRAKTWEPGVYPVVRFALSPEASGSRLLLDHTGFPEGQGPHLTQGWKTNYLEPLAKRFA